MQAWADVEVPQLDFVAPPLRVFSSDTQDLVELPHSGKVTMYVCGITPYDATHIGHATTYLTFDILQRIWRASGANVDYTQNVTDVDDPLIERAEATGRQWQDIAVEQTQLFRTDMVAMRVIPPAHYIGAVESIDLVVKQIEELKKHDAVYELDGDLYYDISKSHLQGKVSHLSPADMLTIFAERGGDPDRAGKRHPLDALLWRHERPHDPSWDTPLGKGRPGWHIECSAIALEYLGDNIHVQGGGADLKFPHHEMSAAHAETATGKRPFAQAYVHVGLVSLDGHKMSKSRGNLVFVSKLRAHDVDPMAIRLTILHNHYRTEWEWFDSALDSGIAKLARWREAFARPETATDVSTHIAQALALDLDTPRAIALIDEWVDATLSGANTSTTAGHTMAGTVDALLGII